MLGKEGEEPSDEQESAMAGEKQKAPDGSVNQAAAVIQALLADGEWHPSRPIVTTAQRIAGGCHTKTVLRAHQRLGVERRKVNGTRATEWRLPQPGSEES